MEGQQVKEVKVTFDPDRQSSSYSDMLLVEYNGQVSSYLYTSFGGRAMYVCILAHCVSFTIWSSTAEICRWEYAHFSIIMGIIL